VFRTQNLIEILSNTVYVAKRTLENGKQVDCYWPTLVEPDVFDGVAAKLAANREKRQTGKVDVNHTFIREGLLRCGSCGSAMTLSVAHGRNDTYFYCRCVRKLKTAGEGGRTRDVPARPVEEFVLNELAEYVVDTKALGRPSGSPTLGGTMNW
jgi:site-specific DNA recombinase